MYCNLKAARGRAMLWAKLFLTKFVLRVRKNYFRVPIYTARHYH